jgi:CubicO group peptidase (beta-lactamase class C family)
MSRALALAIAFAVGVLVGHPAAAAGPTLAEGPSRHVSALSGPVAAAIDARMTEAARHGYDGAVIVESGGKVVLSAGYGFADRAARRPFTTRTPAQIGSITKSFTGLAVSQLAAEGRLDLTKPVKAYAPEAAEPGGSATLEQLLGHRSGLMDDCGDDFDRITRDDLLKRCLAKPLAHPVGEENYSNIGYATLAAVVERVTGQPWERYLAEHVWRPFGMKDTGWTFPGRDRRDFAIGHLKDAPQGVISDKITALGGEVWNLKGDGGLQASAEDMLRYWRGMQRQPAKVHDMMLVRRAPPGVEVMEGHGLFFRFDAKGETVRIGHSGSDGVFFSYIGWLPPTRTFVYFVGSNGEDEVKPVLQDVLKILLHGPEALTKP